MIRRNVFDILNNFANIDCLREYNRLYKLLFSKEVYTNYNAYYTLPQLMNDHIEKWKYRNTCTNFEEVLETLSLNNSTTEEKAVEDLLLLIELILNLEVFRDDIYREDYKNSFNPLNYSSLDPYINNELEKNDLIFENCRRILNSIGYREVREEDRIILVADNPDAITTAVEVEDKNISKLLLDYIDFRNEKDLEVKKNILIGIADYLEPLRDSIPNDDLKNTIFKLFNNVNIRHNNKSGKHKNELASSLTKEEQLEWYDRTFSLSLTAIRLLDFKDDKAIYNQVKE